MKKLDNKGFTLVEVIAVVVIIAVLGMIAVPNVLSTINKSKDSNYDILINNIAIACQQLFEEVEYNNSTIKKYSKNGPEPYTVKIANITSNKSSISGITLQTLVSNGFLTGINNPNKNDKNKNDKIIVNPKTKKDISHCSVRIEKTIGDDYTIEYKVVAEHISGQHDVYNDCPSTGDYDKVLK